MTKVIQFLVLILVFCACTNDQYWEDVPQSKTWEVNRFELDFFYTYKNDIEKLKKQYPLFVNPAIKNEQWEGKWKDTILVQVAEKVKKVYPQKDDFLNTEINKVLNRAAHYFPNFTIDEVYTIMAELDDSQPIYYNHGVLVIPLDLYLGKDELFYSDIAQYKKNLMEKKYVPVRIAEYIAKTVVPKPQKNAKFVHEAIYYGKMQMVMDALLLETSDAEKLLYSEDEMEWLTANERFIYEYFIQEKLLFSTVSADVQNRFFAYAPFSKFYREVDQQSPDRVGRWFGFRIVEAYIDENGFESFEVLLRTADDDVFSQSKYKP